MPDKYQGSDIYWKKCDDKFEEGIQLSMPFDRRHSDPSKNYGIHGMEVIFYVRKNNSAIQFVLYTPTHLDNVADWLYFDSPSSPEFNSFKVLPADVGYHSGKSHYEDQTPSKSCMVIDGDCYSDGSGLHAQEVWKGFQANGYKWLWNELRTIWEDNFGEDNSHD